MDSPSATPARPGVSSGVLLFFLAALVRGATWLAQTTEPGVAAPEAFAASGTGTRPVGSGGPVRCRLGDFLPTYRGAFFSHEP